MDLAKDTSTQLEEYRKHAQNNFNGIFLFEKTISDKFYVTINTSKTTNRQVNRTKYVHTWNPY